MRKSQALEKYFGKSVDDFKTFREKIACARINYYNGKKRKKGLYLCVAARRIGISPGYLCQLENGQRSIPNAAIVHNIERVYGFEIGTLAQLIADDGKKIS